MSVYLDYQAAKPVDVRVISEMVVYLNQKFLLSIVMVMKLQMH